MDERRNVTREVAWRGLDDPQRLDIASIDFSAAGGFVATGTQSTETYRARWDLIVDTRWRTRLLTVDVEGVGVDGDQPHWRRHLDLWRHNGAEQVSLWQCEVEESGAVPEQFPSAGLADDGASRLTEALDADLSGCPLTNTMPVRRLERSSDADDPVSLTMAWVSLPDLAVHPVVQRYGPATRAMTDLVSPLDATAVAAMHYESEARQVSVDLVLDADGVVLTHPQLATRIPLW